MVSPKLRLLAFLMLATFALIGAVNPYPAPVVVVYPLTVGGGEDPEVGANLAVLLSTRLGQGGGVVVKPATPGTARKDFLQAAIALGADYYVTGFLTPLGTDTSFIAQVVSTYSGSVVYSTTAVVRTYADAVAQADVLHEAIINHAGRGLGAYDLPESYPSATAEPTKGQSNQANLSQVFSRRRRATPAPTPSPTPTNGLGEPRVLGAASANGHPAPAAASPAGATLPPAGRRGRPQPTPTPLPTPAPRWLVSTATGDAPDPERTQAQNAFIVALRGEGINAAYLPVSANDVPLHAAQLCRANPGTSRIFVLALSLRQPISGPNFSKMPKDAVYRDALAVGYDCSGKEIAREFSAGGQSPAKLSGVIAQMTDDVARLLVHPLRAVTHPNAR